MRLFVLFLVSLYFGIVLGQRGRTPTALAEPTTGTIVASVSRTPAPSFGDGGGTSSDVGTSVVIDFNAAKAQSTELELRIEIATLMNINPDDVLVVRYTIRSATVIICDGNVNNLVDLVDSRDPILDGTLLEGSDIDLVIPNVPCEIESVGFDTSFSSGSPDAPASATSDFGRSDVKTSFKFSSGDTTFDFPTQELPSSQQAAGEQILPVLVTLFSFLFMMM